MYLSSSVSVHCFWVLSVSKRVICCPLFVDYLRVDLFKSAFHLYHHVRVLSTTQHYDTYKTFKC